MKDYGAQQTDLAVKRTERRLSRVYHQAAKEIEQKMKTWQKSHETREKTYRQLLADGKITQTDFDAWLRGQVFQGNQWKARKEEINSVLLNADKAAAELINSGKLDVFTVNANYIGYSLEHGAGVQTGFTMYDRNTVARLIKDRPKTLPKATNTVNKDKSYTVYNRLVGGAITQGIIQGEDIGQIAHRIAQETGERSYNSAMRNARTAYTGAQNAGRMEGLHQAQDLGIEVKKQWMATLDSRTRDTHADLDGEIVEVDKPFITSDGNEIMYPGDPNAEPCEVYNCRCTLTYVYPEYDFGSGDRRDNETGDVIAGMTYNEWEHAKENGTLFEASAFKESLNDLQGKITVNDANHVFTGIWKDDITYADYEAKKASIPAKRDYLEKKLERANRLGDTQVAEDTEKLLKELDLFEQNGQANYDLLQAFKDTQEGYKELVKDNNAPTPFGPEAYSQARKDAAIWAKDSRDADNALRDVCGEVWRNATPEERDAIYEYTKSYHKYNEPLRGIEYGTNRYLGVGNTDLNAGSARNGARLNAMTDIINKSSYDHDMWFNRGCMFRGMDKFFNVDMNLLQRGTQKEIENELLGKVVTEYGFMSMGSSKGQGFSGDIILNVYTPKGTKMMYVEPFSAFGNGGGQSWDGTSKQKYFGGELETILQQGTELRVTKIDRSGRGGTIYFDLEVVGQSHQQRWQK